MSTPDIAGVQAAAMAAENRRREVASRTPGLGVQMQLPQPPNAAGVGISDVDMPVIGEGYDVRAPAAFQHHSYGPDVPVYAAPEVGGATYPHTGRPAQRSRLAAMADRVFGAQDAAEAAPGVVYVSPQVASRPSLLARLLRRGRR